MELQEESLTKDNADDLKHSKEDTAETELLADLKDDWKENFTQNQYGVSDAANKDLEGVQQNQ